MTNKTKLNLIFDDIIIHKKNNVDVAIDLYNLTHSMPKDEWWGLYDEYRDMMPIIHAQLGYLLLPITQKELDCKDQIEFRKRIKEIKEKI